MNEHPEDLRAEKWLGIVYRSSIVAVLICTLWPFNPFPPNAVSWLPGASGIKFDGAGVVVSESPLRVDETEATESCSLEVLLRPTDTQSVYTILGFYTPNDPRQFLVRQWTDGLLVSQDAVGTQSKVKQQSSMWTMPSSWGDFCW